MTTASLPSSRERLIAATLRQIRDGNLSSVTARTVCHEARVTAPTLYHHFSDMPGLYCEVLEHIFETGLSGHPDERQDPLGVIHYVWEAQMWTAQNEAGVVDLLNQLLSSGKIPDVMRKTYARLETAFEVISRQRPLRVEHRLAAEIYWAAALGICTLLAASQHGVQLPSGAPAILKEAVLDRIFTSREDWKLDRQDA